MMTTNLTIDDSSTDIIYSSNWAVQSSINDPNTDHFFQSTYHSAQGDGASANLTFSGTAIYLYGTKGPGHANYSVQFDNFIIFYSANQSETEYQQLLFGQTFNTSGTHFVSLTSRHASSTDNWLDLDYITITVNETDSNSGVASASASATPPTASPTISPPWVLEASSSTAEPSGLASSSGTALPTESSSSSSSSANTTTLVLAAVFGGIILAGAIFGVGLFLARRRNRGCDDQRPLRPDTPGTGTGGAFAYKPPPSSPSFIGGQLSPISPEPYTAQSPAYDRLLPGPELEGHAHAPGQVHGAILDGRKSPHSTVSLGGATVLTAASTAYLLSPHPHKVVDEPTAHEQTESISTAVARPDIRTRTGRPLPQSRQTSAHLPIYKQHRVFDSESAINVLKQSVGGHAGIDNESATPAIVVLPISTTPPLTEKPDNRRVGGTSTAPDSQNKRRAPLMALHAAHRSESDLSTTTRAAPGAPPRRPKRPGDGLLDFIGSQLAQKLERSASAKRRRDDGNSERTNFLKV
ncbi:hypothetical protein ACEPAI_5428 [Sanghuangporus weigelae]